MTKFYVQNSAMVKDFQQARKQGYAQELYLDPDMSPEDIHHIVFVASTLLGYSGNLTVVEEAEENEE